MFTRKPAPRWHDEIPGTRWFRGDLHLHTLDDHPGGRIRRPPGLSGLPDDADTQLAYARAFLRAAVARGIQVLGLTPHAARAGESETSSTAWCIVDLWNTGSDDDGVPFRDKIYAVFPGFEPSLRDGKSGLHLIFLFDPEIGAGCYQRAFQAVMKGVSPYDGAELRTSPLDGVQALDAIDELAQEENRRRVPAARFGHLFLAPHAFSEKGLCGAMKSQVLEGFPASRLGGLELGDNQLPSDLSTAMAEGVRRDCLALYHSSDAYGLDGPDGGELYRVGSRFTLVKLAEPRVEALRQAMLAQGGSRLRIAFERRDQGPLVVASNIPDGVRRPHPWLRSLSLSGGNSFFAGFVDGHPRTQEFRFSPDLTCVIGGSMTGKSTLLDGLRLLTGRPRPADPTTAAQVEARARERFLLGAPSVKTEVQGDIDERAHGLGAEWPAQFFTQSELRAIAGNPLAIRDIVVHLVEGRARGLQDVDRELRQMDAALAELASEIVRLQTRYGDATQQFVSVKAAYDALERFRQAGAGELRTQQAQLGHVKGIEAALARSRKAIAQMAADAGVGEEARHALQSLAGAEAHDRFLASETSMHEAIVEFSRSLHEMMEVTGASIAEGQLRVERITARIQQALAAAGSDPATATRFEEISRQAGLHEAYKLAVDGTGEALAASRRKFTEERQQRATTIVAERRLLGEALRDIESRFDGSIRGHLMEEALTEELAMWIRDFKLPHLTRWWAQAEARGIGPTALQAALNADPGDYQALGMSEAVWDSLMSSLTQERRLTLEALRCRDRVALELRLESGEYRPLEKLSGGQQVSMLLSLLLRTENRSPLVIDQPEDELDNSFLWTTVLPALRDLKGRRQLIVATHNANLVVNGDADQVIVLEATSDRGTIRAQGAIEAADVRAAIVGTLDGGEEAFRLRSEKYGF